MRMKVYGVKCDKCDGRGYTRRIPRYNKKIVITEKCDACDGTGIRHASIDNRVGVARERE